MGASLTPYLIWPPLVFVAYFLNGYCTVHFRQEGDLKWFLLTWLTTAIPLWVIVSKFFQNLVFDVILFNVVLMIAFYCSLLYLGELNGVAWYQWMGLGACIIGLIVIQL